MSPAKRNAVLVILVLVFGGVSAILFRGEPPAVATPPATAPTTRSVADPDVLAAMRQPLQEIRFTGVLLSDARDYLTDITKQNFYTDSVALRSPGVGNEPRVTFDAKAPTLEHALAGTLASVKDAKESLRYEVIGSVIMISTEKRLNLYRRLHLLDAQIKDPSPKVTLDQRLPELRFESVSFADVVDFMRDVTGRKIFVDWKSLEAAGINRTDSITVRLRNAPFRECLASFSPRPPTASNQSRWRWTSTA